MTKPSLRRVALQVAMAACFACGERLPDAPAQGPSARPTSAAFDPADSTRHRVVGGLPARANQYPATGVLLYTFATSRPGTPIIGAMLCSGTLIAPDVVVLAAHCGEQQVPAHYTFLRVDYYFSLSADVSGFGPQVVAMPHDVVKVAHIERHPQYEFGSHQRRLGNADDIGLVYLERPLGVTPMRIADPRRASELLRPGASATIVGYGRSQDVFFSTGDDGKKMVGHSTLADVGDFELEIGLHKEDAFKCFGDSGGPTFMRDGEGEEWMVGITSRGATLQSPRGQGRGGSACRQGGIDTRLDVYLPWLNDRLTLACDTGQRPACVPSWRSLPPSSP